jgi:hypothetical protein
MFIFWGFLTNFDCFREITSKEIAYYNFNTLKEAVCYDNLTTMVLIVI